jgi:hypothetical protein
MCWEASGHSVSIIGRTGLVLAMFRGEITVMLGLLLASNKNVYCEWGQCTL